jgi:hypothetical protein
VAEAFHETPGSLCCIFTTASQNETVARIKSKDPRIEVFPFLPRKQLFQKMKNMISESDWSPIMNYTGSLPDQDLGILRLGCPPF